MAQVPGDVAIQKPQDDAHVAALPTFEQLDVLGIDGTKEAIRTHNEPRSFALPTETFVRKTGRRDRGPPGFEYSNTEHLSISAVKPGAPGSAVFLAPSASRSWATLPGVNVRAYAPSPTRDNRSQDAERAAQVRDDQARRIATRSKREKKLLAAAAASFHRSDKPGDALWNSKPGSLAMVIRAPRARVLEDQTWREALKFKARATAPSPRDGKPSAMAVKGRGDTPHRRARKRAAPIAQARGMFHGVKVPLDAFSSPFAGGKHMHELPGRIESLIFPQRHEPERRRYLNWPKEDAALPALALDVQNSPIRHAVAFRSNQPRIVCGDSQRETRGWDGPGAYEWDERPSDSNSNNDDGSPRTGDGGGKGGSTSGAKGVRARGMAVRDPDRLSPVFREGSSGFIPARQTNVREFSAVPVSARGGSTGHAELDGGLLVGGSKEGSAGNRKRASESNGRRKKPQTLWMFHPAGKTYQAPVATEGWNGPGAYAFERRGKLAVFLGSEVLRDTGIQVKECGRMSPVFRASSGRRGPSRPERDVSAFPARPGGCPDTAGSSPGNTGRRSPATPDIMAKWPVPYPEFKPPEPKTMAHDIKRSPVRFGASFLSVKGRFEPVGPYAFISPATPPSGGPGAGETTGGGRSGGLRGPVERYDLVSARLQPPISATWLGTSIRPGLPYNSSLRADTTASSGAHLQATTTSTPAPSSHHPGREDDISGDASETRGRGDSTAVGPGESTVVAAPGAPGEASGTDTSVSFALAAVGKRVVTKARGLRAIAESEALEAANTVAARLAQNWPCSRRGADSGGALAEARGEKVSETQSGSAAVYSHGGSMPTSKPLGGEVRGEPGVGVVASHHGGGGGSEEMGEVPTQESVGAMIAGDGECTRPCILAEGLMADRISVIPAVSNCAVTDVRRIAAASRKAPNARSSPPWFRGKENKRYAASAAEGMAVQAQVDGTDTSVANSSLGVMTAEGLAAAEASTAVAAAEQNRKSLIRTVGRAKRGPCMLTLSSSPQTERRVAKDGTIVKAHIATGGRVWETEANNGLSGPGESNVIIC